MRPAPLEPGDCAHLRPRTIRWSVARQMRLGAAMTAQATGAAPPEYVALLAGADVVLTRAQVRSFVPASLRPANLDAWPRWLLRGDDELIVWRRKRKA